MQNITTCWDMKQISYLLLRDEILANAVENIFNVSAGTQLPLAAVVHGVVFSLYLRMMRLVNNPLTLDVVGVDGIVVFCS